MLFTTPLGLPFLQGALDQLPIATTPIRQQLFVWPWDDQISSDEFKPYVAVTDGY